METQARPGNGVGLAERAGPAPGTSDMRPPAAPAPVAVEKAPSLAAGRLHPLAAAAGAAILCGAAVPALRMAQMQARPAQVAMLRYAVAALCLLAVYGCARGLRSRRVDWRGLALVDFGQFGVLSALMVFGLHFTSATRGGLVAACLPMLVLLFAVPLQRRLPGSGFVVGVLLCGLGILFALGDGPYVRHARLAWLGEVSIFVAAALAALCSLLARPFALRLAALPLGAAAMGASVLLLVLLAGHGFNDFRLAPRGWLLVLYLGVSCAAAHALWVYALSRAPLSRVLPWLAAAPLVSAMLGAHSLHERHSAWLLAGLACVALGLALALRAAGRAMDGEREDGQEGASAAP
jgi:drug/metabolite transporter (DMT)-like permease